MNSSRMSSTGEVIHDGEELGFFILQDTAVILCGGCNQNYQGSTSDWLTVNLITEDPAGVEKRKKKKIESDIDDEECYSSHSSQTTRNVETCSRCNLVLHMIGYGDGTSRLQCRLSDMCSFDGCVQDMNCCEFHKKSSGLDDQKKRSDSALLLGTIMKCEKAGIIRIESFRVLLNRTPEENEATNRNEQEYEIDMRGKRSREELTGNHKKVFASVVITVSLPHLEKLSRVADHDKYHPVKGYDDYLSTNGQILSPSGRLLFALIRNDWDWLDKATDRLANNCRRDVVSDARVPQLRTMFPDSITLEELYARIRGASISRLASFRTMNLEEQKRDESLKSFAGDLLLPDDIQSKIASYLRAKSLHSLRSTCRYMNEVLESIVPGMKLKLFPHQIRSLQWMRRREEIPMTEEDALMAGPNNNSVDEVLSGDLYRSVTSGGIVSLSSRHNRKVPREFWQVNAWTGSCSNHRDKKIRTVAKCRKVARGGLLCDDPGLGKTISILSLILQTFGQTTERINHKEGARVSEGLIIDTYWREELVHYTRQDALLGLVLKLRKYDLEQFFQYPVKDSLSDDEFAAYKEVVKNPLCMEDIIRNIHNDLYHDNIRDFATDVRRIYNNAQLYNNPQTIIHKRAEGCSNQFEDSYTEFRRLQLSAAISKQKRSKLSLGSLILENNRQMLRDTLLPSMGSLIVVPPTLMQHWEEQIKLHIDLAMCSRKEPLIFRHRHSNNYTLSRPYKEVSNCKTATELCQERMTHFPFLFIDECIDKLPSADFMSTFSIVLTTTKRLTSEWKNGSFEEELQKSEGKAKTSYRNFNYDVFNEYAHTSPCSLLKVNWLRLVVDEGHNMARKGPPTNAIDFASWITAERRWAMSGTPTPQTISKNGMANLFGLFKFLNHDYFSTITPHSGDLRFKAIDRGLKNGHLASFFKLRHLLNLLMVRHTKADVQQLHKPIFTKIQTNMSLPEKMAYNTLVTAVQMNMVTTSMEGKTSGKQDSLLNARQLKHAKLALSNIRLACSGGTKVMPTLTIKNWTETIDLMRKQHHADDVKVTLVENFLHRMTTEQLSSCMCCGLELQTLFLLPCSCHICTECVNPKSTNCPSCRSEFDVDDFQKLQPGLEYTWKWNIIESKKEREQKRLLNEALEATLQRAAQDGNLQRDDNGLIDAVDENVNIRRRRRRRIQRPHVCEYPDSYVDGKCQHCGEVHLCTLIKTSQCAVCNYKAEDCPRSESKSYYITSKLINLLSLYTNRPTNLKVLIFTQFQQISNLVGDRLIRRFGLGCIAEYWGQTRNLELARFTKSKECFCLLLNKDGSHGLNLSFVTHIFFLDEIFDKSLESQVIARAYRMGATAKVFVEQLVARDSIEELIVQMNRTSNEIIGHNHGDKRLNPQAKKVGFLLSNVKLMRPPKPIPSIKVKQTDKTKRKKVMFTLSV